MIILPLFYSPENVWHQIAVLMRPSTAAFADFCFLECRLFTFGKYASFKKTRTWPFIYIVIQLLSDDKHKEICTCQTKTNLSFINFTRNLWMNMKNHPQFLFNFNLFRFIKIKSISTK